MTDSSRAAASLPAPRRWMRWFARIIAGLSILLVGGIVLLRLLGLMIPYKVPTGAMSPAIEPGDQVLMEGFTYLYRAPQRGDLAVFSTAGIKKLEGVFPASIYVKRIAGVPGDELRISQGKLYVNGAAATMRNEAGEITYTNTGSLRTGTDTVSVPEGHYFVLGDNSDNSSDSRYWGFVPKKNIKGRVSICYLPSNRRGQVE